MFSFFKGRAGTPQLKLFRMTLSVGRGESEMPANLVGAYVPMFVGAADHQAGLERAVRKLQAQGYEFLDLVDGQVYELDPEQWDQFVGDAWPEFAPEFPKQEEVLKGLEREFLFTGPFIGYELQKAE